MKKLISLLLILVLCLSLYACGSETITPTTSTDVFFDATTGKPTTAPTTPTIAPTVSTTAPTAPPEEEVPSLYQRWINRMTGTWFTTADKEMPFETYTINNDGTMVINGESYSIGMTTQETWKWAKLSICQGDTEVYSMRVDLEDDGQLSMSFSPSIGVKYFRNDQYDVVSITADNWLDYYEFYWEYKPNVNGFDEVESAQCWFGFRLKAEYASLVQTECGSVSVELSFSRGTQYGTFSSDKKTFTPDGAYQKWEGADCTEIYDMSGASIMNGKSYAIATAHFEENSCGPLYPSNEQVLRATGTLYLYNGTP